MGPKRNTTRTKSYVPAPSVPEEYFERYMLLMGAATGRLSVAEAARRLGMSRNHFQTLMHRGLSALIEAIIPHPAGRPPRSEREVALEEQVERLERQVAKLESEAQTSHRLLAVASEVLRGRERPSRERPRRTKKTSTSGEEPEEPEPDPEPEQRFERAREMTSSGIRARLAAAAVGLGASTLRRWAARRRKGEPLRRRRGPRPGGRPVDAATAQRVAQHVRDLRGLVGADSLRQTFPGVSRRQAASIKHRTLTALERERKQAVRHVRVAIPGVVRGFDAVHLHVAEHRCYALIAADACVPYRTTARSVPRYDGPSVAETVEQDIALHGAPLVYRMDRASAHRVGEVKEVLDQHAVLLLHGPAHYPCFYGQHERQNREHRGWLGATDDVAPELLDPELAVMTHALNELWRRRTLDWKTAGELWRCRPNLQENRIELRHEVSELAARFERQLADHRDAHDRAWRLGIEHALTQRGYLHVDNGRWC